MSGEQTTETVEVVEGADQQVETTIETVDQKPDTPKTVFDSKDEVQTAPQTWPDDWRVQMAGGDEAAAKRLSRFKSPAGVLKSYLSLEHRMSSGEMTSKLAPDASSEDVTAWREANGIPSEASKYLENLPDGLTIGDDAKERVMDFAGKMHELNAAPEIVQAAIAWNEAQVVADAEKRAEADATFVRDAEDVLRAEWGGEYRMIMSGIESLLDSGPALADGTSLKDAFIGGRLADGRPITASPEMLQWFADMVTQVNPAAFITPGSTSPNIDSIDARIAEINNMMKTGRAAYFDNSAIQEEYRGLLEAKQKLEAAA